MMPKKSEYSDKIRIYGSPAVDLHGQTLNDAINMRVYIRKCVKLGRCPRAHARASTPRAAQRLLFGPK